MTETATGAPVPTGLPVGSQAFEPDWVRKGSASTQRAYALAESFEAVLMQQLAQSMASTSGLDGEEEGSAAGETGAQSAPGTSAPPSELSSLLPQALSDGVMGAGGLGVAAQLTRELEPASTQPPGDGHGSVGASANAAAGDAIGKGGGGAMPGEVDTSGGVAA